MAPNEARIEAMTYFGGVSIVPKCIANYISAAKGKVQVMVHHRKDLFDFEVEGYIRNLVGCWWSHSISWNSNRENC